MLGGTGTDPNLAVILMVFLIMAKLSSSPNAIKQTNLTNKKPIMSFPWHLVGGISGLAAVVIGILPPIASLPSAIGKPLALHIIPPPLPVGPIIPLATLAGQLDVSLLASSHRLQVSLQAPLSNSKFFLSGTLKSPTNKPKQLRWPQCGRSCFVRNASWSKGINQVTLHTQAAGWKGGTVSFKVPWPAHSDPQLLHKVLVTMRHVNSIVTNQTVTSNTKGPTFPSLQVSVSGPQLLTGEPYGLEPPAKAIILAHSAHTTTLALAYPTGNIDVQLVIDQHNRIIHERLTSPHHLIEASLHYPK